MHAPALLAAWPLELVRWAEPKAAPGKTRWCADCWCCTSRRSSSSAWSDASVASLVSSSATTLPSSRALRARASNWVARSRNLSESCISRPFLICRTNRHGKHCLPPFVPLGNMSAHAAPQALSSNTRPVPAGRPRLAARDQARWVPDDRLARRRARPGHILPWPRLGRPLPWDCRCGRGACGALVREHRWMVL